jgi:colicin import membrane protein
MQDTERNAFQPPQPGGQGRSFALALVAHALLVMALTWGINWKSQPNDLSVTAELWSAVPREAAPRLQESQEPIANKPLPAAPPEPVKPEPEPETQTTSQTGTGESSTRR